MRYLFFISCLFSCIAGYAQTLKGTVTDATGGKALSPVVVVNTSTQQSVYTAVDGTYSLPAQAGDLIALTYIGYKTIQWKMPATLGTTTQNFKMQLLNYQLKEFTVRTKNYTQYQVDSLERHSTYQRTLARQRTGSLTSPVTFIAERVSKKSKQIYNFKKQYYYWEDQRFIDSRYTPELVGALTNLSGDTLGYFMNAYPMPYEYARTATDLEVKMWIRNNYRQWLSRQPDSTQMINMAAGAKH